MDFSNLKELLAGAYRASWIGTVIAIYGVAFLLALTTHLYIKSLSAETQAQPSTTQGAPALGNGTTVIQQQSGDANCSNIVAGRDANVDCHTAERNDDKRKAPSHKQ